MAIANYYTNGSLEDPSDISSSIDRKLIVSPEVRERLLERYPAMRPKPSTSRPRGNQPTPLDLQLRRAFAWFVFLGPSSSSGLSIVTHDYVKAILRCHSPTASKLESLFSDNVFPICIGETDRTEFGFSSRHLLDFPLCIADQELLMQHPGDNPVSFVTGEPISLPSRPSHPASGPASELLDFLNAHDKSDFLFLQDRITSIPAVAKDLLVDTHSYVRAISCFQPENLPISYKSGSKSLRLYAVGPNPLGAPREIRKVAYAGTLTLDLKQCQLVIVSSLLDLQVVKDYLAKCPSGFFTSLLSDLGLQQSLRERVKAATYAVVYGAGNWTIRTTLGLSKRQADKFIAHPVIAALIAARDRKLKELNDGGQLTDAFGRPTATVSKENSCRSLFACWVQSYEFKIMAAGALQARDLGLRVPCWLHDGFSILAPDGSCPTLEQQDEIENAIRSASLDCIGTVIEIEATRPSP